MNKFVVPSLPTLSLNSEDLPLLETTFASCEAIPIVRDFPEGDPTAPPTGHVQLLASGTTLHLFAVLHDTHIFTNATAHNDRLWLLGDTFEIFIKRPDASHYLEFHVAPNNLTLQLLFPYRGGFKKCGHTDHEEFLRSRMLPGRRFISGAWVQPEQEQWKLYAAIDLTILDAEMSSLISRDFQFSFCRYDYTPGKKKPVQSSTSRMDLLDFHRYECWNLMTFQTA